MLFNATDEVGLGHCSRALSLGRFLLQKNVNCELVHLGALSRDLNSRLKSFCAQFSQDFTVANSPDDLKTLYTIDKFTHGLVDVSQNFDHDIWQIDQILEGSILATFDDLTPFRKKADLCFYPPLTNISKLDWNEHSGKIFSGLEYYIYRPELDGFIQSLEPNYEYDICVTCGGSNNASLTERVLDILKNCNFKKALVILGPTSSFQYDTSKLNNIIVIENPENYIELISKSRLIINTYGVSVFELLYLGKDAITICLEPDHTEAARMFSDKGNFEFIDISEVDDKLSYLILKKTSKIDENRKSGLNFSLNEKIYLELERASKI